jgi:phospholipase C
MSDHETEGPAQGGVLGKKLSRRRMLQATGVTAGALVFGGLGAASDAAAATSGADGVGRTGTIADVKHVVVMMQENRPFDHYFGTLPLPGVAGFGDKQAVQFENGRNIFFQPNARRPEGYLLPFRLDTTRFNAQPATPNMGYYEPEDIPWQAALASAYTLGDHYHCGLVSSTTPNRCMMWSGTNDPDGDKGGPAINNNGDYLYAYMWETYPEILQKAGVSWQVYVNNDIDDNFFGDFTDNTVGRDFAAFNPANANAQNTVPRQGLLARANVLQTHTTPPATIPNSPSLVNLDYVLKDFIADCAAGLIPEISYVVAPAHWSEHPGSTPDWGAVYVNRVIQALHDNPDLWNSTLLIVDYDENGGNFDHVLRPVPEAGTKGEGAPGLHPGTGPRVPLILVSPWTRGGWVAKETFDHTSLIQFMELFTTSLGKPAICQNISAWRRSVCGDLTSAIDFTSFDNSLPELPDPSGLLAAVVNDASLPPVTQPAPGQQTVPVQQVEGALKLRVAPYQQHASILVDRSAGTVTATMTNDSSKAASMQVYTGTVLATPFAFNADTAKLGIPNTVSKATGPKTYTATGGRYDFSIYGPDHFVRSFAGTVIPDGENGGQVPQADARLHTGDTPFLKITLSNGGRTPVQYTLTPNDYSGERQTVTAGFGQHVSIDWPTSPYGYYDVIITTNTSDGFTQRYAGRIRTGSDR